MSSTQTDLKECVGVYKELSIVAFMTVTKAMFLERSQIVMGLKKGQFLF